MNDTKTADLGQVHARALVENAYYTAFEKAADALAGALQRSRSRYDAKTVALDLSDDGDSKLFDRALAEHEAACNAARGAFNVAVGDAWRARCELIAEMTK